MRCQKIRNKYTEEYKTSAVKMVLEEGKTPVEVAHNLGKPVGLLQMASKIQSH